MTKDITNPTLAYTVKGAVEASGISRSMLFLLIRENKLESRKVGRTRLILAPSLRRFLEQHAS